MLTQLFQLLVQHMFTATAARYPRGTSGRGKGEVRALGGSRAWTRDKCPPHAPRAAHGHVTDVALNVSQRASKSWRYVKFGSHKTFHRKTGPKVGGKSMPKVDVSSAIPSCGRALPNALVEPDGLLRPLLRTPTPRCSGPREPGVAAASTARRGRCERPRRALAPRLPRPPELRGACGRAACAAPRRSARRRLPSVTAEPRVAPPNAQVSERAKACRARRTR